MTPPGARRLRLEATTRAADRRSVLVTARSSVRYLSGFTGSAGALWIPLESPPVLVTDFRYEEQVDIEVADSIRTHISREGWIRGVAEVAADAAGPGAERPPLGTEQHHHPVRLPEGVAAEHYPLLMADLAHMTGCSCG